MTGLEKDTSASNDSSKILLESERTRTTIYSRVMGYHSPTHLWNHGKKSEWEDRRSAFFSEEKAIKHIEEIENGTDSNIN